MWTLDWFPKTKAELERYHYERRVLAREKRHWEKAHGINPYGSGISRTKITDDNMITIETEKGTKTWLGDPTDTAAIAIWKQSYEPGYKTQIISPRDASGNYTADPQAMVTHAIITKDQQAGEIIHSLHGETKVPTSIIQSLGKTLGVVTDKFIHKDAPTGITDTKRITGDGTIQSRLTDTFKGKISAITVALFIIIFFSLHLYKKR